MQHKADSQSPATSSRAEGSCAPGDCQTLNYEETAPLASGSLSPSRGLKRADQLPDSGIVRARNARLIHGEHLASRPPNSSRAERHRARPQTFRNSLVDRGPRVAAGGLNLPSPEDGGMLNLVCHVVSLGARRTSPDGGDNHNRQRGRAVAIAPTASAVAETLPARPFDRVRHPLEVLLDRPCRHASAQLLS